MIKLDKYDSIILDCDGVIFDSNNLKLEAFREALKDYEIRIVDEFIEYCKSNFGTSRYNLVKVFLDKFIQTEFDKNMYNIILKRYSENCVLLYQKSKFTDSFFSFIEKYKKKEFYVASGSDQNELREVFRQRGVNKYFIDIFGSPKRKMEIVKGIVTENKRFVMIGDALSDKEAAKEAEIDFIFMSNYSTNEEMRQDSSLNRIKNLRDFI